VLQSRQRPSELQWKLQLKTRERRPTYFLMSTGSSIQVQPAAGHVSFSEPSVMKCVDIFLTMLLEAHAGSFSLVQVVGDDPRLG
jgi:hypothetical protein